MTRSFWGFGYSNPHSNKDNNHRSIPPPIPTFATPTTAISSVQPNVVHPTPPSMTSRKQISKAGFGNLHSNHHGNLHPQQPSANDNISIPETATIQGKLKVRVCEARNLSVKLPTSRPYVVVNCSTSEHISKSVTNGMEGVFIPTKQQPSQQTFTHKADNHGSAVNPQWDDEATFDMTSSQQNIEITVFDAGDNERFLGQVSIPTNSGDGWFKLQPLLNGEVVSGEIRVQQNFQRSQQRQFGPQDFEILRLIGKGTFGQVYQVRKRDSKRVYAMKVLSKRLIIQRKEVAHTIGERDILVRTSSEGSHFLVGLKFSFQTSTDLYLVTDYMSGGELFWHLQREGRFSERRAKFYIAELVVALEHLHNNDIVYRDLKPENILLDASGHVALCDFGLSKANLHNGTTNTFCGTTEYLAPEVLLDDKGYTKMVDFWSLGVLIFEMCCGWSPFYAEDNQQMYKNIAFGKVRFPKDALSPEGRDFVKGLLNRNPLHRLGATDDAKELMAHPFFHDVDWAKLRKRQIPPPYKPTVTSEDDTSNFDPEFTSASTSVLTKNLETGSTPMSPGFQDKFKGFTFVDDNVLDDYFKGKSVSASFRAPPPIKYDEGIDLYDENEIKISHSYYDSGLKHKFGDDDMEEDDANYNDFVEGQGFEI